MSLRFSLLHLDPTDEVIAMQQTML